MATYEVLFVGAGASAAVSDTTIIDMIEAYTDDTWNVTYRAQSGSKDPTGYDLVVFPSTGIFNSNWATTGWNGQDVPMVIPANRSGAGNEPFSTNGQRGGSYTSSQVTADGAAHEIGVHLGWAEDDLVQHNDAGTQSYRNDSGQLDSSDAIQLLYSTATRFQILVAETGDTMGSGTATNRRIAWNQIHNMDSSAEAVDVFEACIKWLVGGLGGAAEHTGTGTADMSMSGTGSAQREALADGTASTAITSTGAGQRTATESGSASTSITASATGQREGISSTGTAALAMSGTGAGSRSTTGTGSASVAMSATGSAQREALASGAGALAFTSSGDGVPTRLQEGSAALAMAGVATGKRTALGSGTGDISLSAEGGYVPSGSAEVELSSTASGTRLALGAIGAAAMAATGTATGQRTASGDSTAAVSMATTATGQRDAFGQGAADVAVSGTATGRRNHYGAGTAASSMSSVATGQREALAVGTAAGSITTNAPEGQRSTSGTGTASASMSATGTAQREAQGTADEGLMSMAALAIGRVIQSASSGSGTIQISAYGAGKRQGQGDALVATREPANSLAPTGKPDELSGRHGRGTMAPAGHPSAIQTQPSYEGA